MEISTCGRCGCPVGDAALHDVFCLPKPAGPTDARLAAYCEHGELRDIESEGGHVVTDKDGPEYGCWINGCTSDGPARFYSGRGVHLCEDCALMPATHELHCRDL